jgi:thiol-disulfide isomerase/thioredoxin
MSTDRVFHGLLRWGYALISNCFAHRRRCPSTNAWGALSEVEGRRNPFDSLRSLSAGRRSRRDGRAVLLCVAIAFIAASLPASAQAPFFEQRDLQGAVDSLNVVDLQGRRWTAAELSNRVVLIEFWASWCAPCLAQFPDFKRLKEKHGDQFEILAISLDSSTRRDLVAWLNRQSVSWPQVHDGRAFNSPAVRPFGVTALPASLLIAGGKIAAANLRGRELEEAVDYLVSTRTFDAARVPIVIR